MRFFITFALILSAAFTPSAKASLSEKDITLAVLGEARGESEKGKTALAEALRNRDSMRGVYGYQAEVKARAETERAVQASKTSRLVDGADVWGTDADVKKFKRTKWFRRYVFVVKIGAHSYFKRRK